MKIKITSIKQHTINNRSHSCILNEAICGYGIFKNVDIIIAYLEKYRPDLVISTTYSNNHVITLLCSKVSVLSSESRIQVLKWIIKEYNPSITLVNNQYGLPPLVYAMSLGDIPLLKYLFSIGADLHSAFVYYNQKSTRISGYSTSMHVLQPNFSEDVRALLKETLYEQTLCLLEKKKK